MDVVVRSVHRAGITPEYSSGFHPHPRLSFGPPLSVGIESNAEFFDLRVRGVTTAAEVCSSLAASVPEGFAIHECRGISAGSRSLGKFVVRYDYLIDAAKPPEIPGRLVVRRDDRDELDISGCVRACEASEAGILLSLVDQETYKVRLAEVCGALGFGSLVSREEELRITRTALWGRKGDRWVSPMDAT